MHRNSVMLACMHVFFCFERKIHLGSIRCFRSPPLFVRLFFWSNDYFLCNLRTKHMFGVICFCFENFRFIQNSMKELIWCEFSLACLNTKLFN